MRTPFVLALAGATALFAQEDRIQRSAPAPQGGRVYLTAEFGSIDVQPSASRTVDVEVYFRGNAPSRSEFDRMLRDFTLEVTPQGNDVRVYGTFRDGWRSDSFFGRFGGRWCRNNRCLEYDWLRELNYRIRVPNDFSADVSTSGGSITVGDLNGTVDVRTSGGSLHLGRIGGTVNGRTSGGSITLLGSRGRATVRTSGGSIRIDEVEGDVDASTSGGSIEVARSSGRVTVHTSGGGINIRETKGPVDASTSGGSITVGMPANAAFELDAHTSGGSVSSEFPITISGDIRRNEVRGPVNGGGPLLRLRTSGGGIRVRRA